MGCSAVMQWEFASKKIGISFGLALFRCKAPSYWNVNAFESFFTSEAVNSKKFCSELF